MPQRTLTAWLGAHAGLSPRNMNETTIRGIISDTAGTSGEYTSRTERVQEKTLPD